MLCSPSDLPAKGFSNQIPLVARGNCTFYEKVRLAQGSGARGLLIVSKETLVRLLGTPLGAWDPGRQDPGKGLRHGQGAGQGRRGFGFLAMNGLESLDCVPGGGPALEQSWGADRAWGRDLRVLSEKWAWAMCQPLPRPSRADWCHPAPGLRGKGSFSSPEGGTEPAGLPSSCAPSLPVPQGPHRCGTLLPPQGGLALVGCAVRNSCPTLVALVS